MRKRIKLPQKKQRRWGLATRFEYSKVKNKKANARKGI